MLRISHIKISMIFINKVVLQMTNKQIFFRNKLMRFILKYKMIKKNNY